MARPEKDHFLLGIFGPNCSSGMSVTKIPERWNNSWENNLKLAHMLEDAGVDFSKFQAHNPYLRHHDDI
jgi:hypothetical protein